MPKSLPQSSLSDNFSTLSYNMRKSKIPIWLWNPYTKAILGKTSGGWFKLLVFYIIFYLCLILFWTGMMAVFLYLILPTNYPMRTGMHSLLKFKPGLSMRPMIDHETPFIRYSSNDTQTYMPYVQSMDAFLNSYFHLESKPPSVFAKCYNSVKVPNDPKKICKFELAQLGPCNSNNFYGYKSNKPCVFIKMNKIYGWLPEVTNTKIPNPLISCFGSNPLDKENIGKLNYYPSISINGTNYGYYDNSYYPYIGQPDYVAPIVAVEFTNLKPSIITHVTCRLNNIPVEPTGEVKFEMVVDL